MVLELEIPKGKEFVSIIDYGKSLLFDDFSICKLPKGKWVFSHVKDDKIYLKSKNEK